MSMTEKTAAAPHDSALDQAKVLDLIADHQLASEEDISGNRLLLAIESLGLQDVVLPPMLDVLIEPTERIPPRDRYRLTIFGWVFSKHVSQVNDLIGATLALLADTFAKTPDATHYSWDSLRRYLTTLDDQHRYFVRQILDVGRLGIYEGDRGWKIPWDIRAIRKMKTLLEFVQYRAQRDADGRMAQWKAQQRLDMGFDPFDDSSDAIIEHLLTRATAAASHQGHEGAAPLSRNAAPVGPHSHPESGLASEVYEHILSVIRHEGRTFEGAPDTFSKHDEEGLRDILIAHLNGHYPGRATAETFRKTGKTDIRIEDDNRRAFVAECKIWHGAKHLADACSQLLGYLTWRDGKAALIIFNRSVADFSGLLGTVPSQMRNSGYFLTEEPTNHLGEWRFRFSSKDDKSREVILHVFLFNLHFSR